MPYDIHRHTALHEYRRRGCAALTQESKQQMFGADVVVGQDVISEQS
jgi:hypothetical protein